MLVFFFQAEDGIRDVAVTGVQTCALPISDHRRWQSQELRAADRAPDPGGARHQREGPRLLSADDRRPPRYGGPLGRHPLGGGRSEEHTSELQSRLHLVCRLLLEKKNKVSTTSVRVHI